MNVSIIEEIKKAEEKAKLILDSSKEESKKIFNDALVKAEAEYENIVNSANDQYKKIILDCEKESSEYVNSLEKKFEASVSEIFDISDERKKLAIKKVVEGIVNVWQ